MKTAIVTGASSGIGYCIAIQLAKLNYSLALVGRSERKLLAVQNKIRENGGDCFIILTDLENEESSKVIVEKTLAHYGQIDVLINNAGMAHSAQIVDTDAETWNKIFSVNVRSVFLLCKAAIPALKNAENPFIINIGSVVGFKGYTEQAVYASSKHALAGFTKVLAKEVQKDGIQVHLISPGGVNTEMATAMRPDIDKENLILPEEIAELIEFLLTRRGKGTIDHLYIRRKNGLAFD